MSGIDVKTLRDGDFVRAEGVRDGKPWAAEGVVERCSYGECAAQVRVGPAFGADIHLVDCTVTMLRPVLVKGDRVDLRGVTHQVESVHENGCIVITDANDMPRAVHIADLTRLPAAPEPAPIEVGSWWESKHGAVAVVTGHAECGDPILRWWTDKPGVESSIPADSLREHWTLRDGAAP